MPRKLKNVVLMFCLIVSLPLCAHSQKNAPENDNLNKNLKNEEAPQPRYPLLEVLSETSMVRKYCQETSRVLDRVYCKNLEKHFYCASHYVSDKQNERIQERINRGKFSWRANANFNDYKELATYYFCACYSNDDIWTDNISSIGQNKWSKEIIEAESRHFDHMLHVQKRLHNKYPGEDNIAGKRYDYFPEAQRKKDKPILNEKPSGYVNNFDELDALPHIQTYCQRIGSKECDFISAVLYCRHFFRNAAVDDINEALKEMAYANSTQSDKECDFIRYFSKKASQDDIQEVLKKMAYGTYTQSDLDFKLKMKQTLNFCRPCSMGKSESDAQKHIRIIKGKSESNAQRRVQKRIMNAAIQICSALDLTYEETIHETAQLLSMLYNK